MGITRKDNGDGTTTFSGVDVTIPSILANEYDVVEVRKPQKGDIVELSGLATSKVVAAVDATYTILTPRPIWKPPASLMPGEYTWNGRVLLGLCCVFGLPSRMLRGWTDPPRVGRWRVNEDGTATFLGES